MRQRISLYIADLEVDLGDQTLILFNYTMDDLSNPTIVKNSYSQQITLQGTPNNNKIFGDVFRLDRSQIYDSSYSGASFDPSRKTPFYILNEANIILESGYVKLDEVTRKGQDVEYSISLYGGLGSFLYQLAYDANGNKRTLADIRYFDDSTDKESELNFTINATNVLAAWSRMDGEIPSVPSSLWDVINFAPCYNGIPENFDASKGIINGSSVGLPTYYTQDGVTYYQKNGYTLVQMTKDMTEWAVKDLRSYLQRPVLSIHAFLYALTNTENVGGFNFDCSEMLNSYFAFSHLWMTLPLLPTLPTYRTIEEDIDVTINSTFRKTAIPVTLSSEIPAGSLVNISLQTTLAVSSAEAYAASKAKLYFYRYRHTQDTWNNYYHEDVSGMFVQLLAYDSNNNIVGGSKVICIGDITGKHSILNVSIGLSMDTKSRAETFGYSPLYGAGDDDIWGDYVATDLSNNQSYGTYTYVVNKVISMNVSAYGIDHLAINVTPYWYHKYITQHFIGKDVNTDKLTGDDAMVLMSINTYNYTKFRSITTGSESNTATYKTSDMLRSGAKITKAMLLTTNYTPADLLLSLTKMFGFYFTYDMNTNTIKVQSRNSLYQDDVIDLEKRICRDRDITITPFVFDTKWLKMMQEIEGSAFASKYAALYGREYGIQMVDTGYDFNAEINDLTSSLVVKAGVTSCEYGRYFNYVTQDSVFRPSPFLDAGNKHILWSTSGDTIELDVPVPASPTISYFSDEEAEGYEGYDYLLDRKLQLHDADGKPLDGDGILLFHNSTGNYQHFKVTDDTAVMLNINGGTPCWFLRDGGTSTLRLPIFSRFRDGDGYLIESSLDFGRVRELNCVNLAYSAYNDVTIYEKAWKKYMEDRYSVNTRVVRCHVDMRGLDVSQNALRKFYYFDHCLWVLNRIINYSLTTFDPVECEFVKVNDKDNYLNGQEYYFGS